MISVGFYFERWRGVATSLTSCGSGVGILAMPLCYKAMSGYVGYTWRWILAFNASVFGVVGLLSMLLKPLQPVALSAVRGERTVRFQEAPQTRGKTKASLRWRGWRGWRVWLHRPSSASASTSRFRFTPFPSIA